MRLTIIFLFVGTTVFCQQVDYNTIILPKTASDIEFHEKLVQLAWQNDPRTRVFQSEISKADNETKLAKFSFLDDVRITGNLNEFNIAPDQTTQQLFFPRYNISASISLGSIFTDPLRTKLKQQDRLIIDQNINKQKLAVRAEVLKKYQIYLSNREIADIRAQMLEDAFSDFQLKEQNFAVGESTLVEYNAALDKYNVAKITKIQADKEVEIAKLDVEQMIGLKLEDVF